MDDEIIDLPLEERSYHEAVQWWEKKRLIFNVLVGLSGLTCIAMNLNAFQIYDIFNVVLWGGLANILFSTGTFRNLGSILPKEFFKIR